MSLSAIVPIALVLIFNALVSRRVIAKHGWTERRKRLLLALVWLLPGVGAIACLGELGAPQRTQGLHDGPSYIDGGNGGIGGETSFASGCDAVGDCGGGGDGGGD